MKRLAEFAPFSPETIADPYPFHAALRREAHVYRLEDAGCSMVGRYADCLRVAMAPETFSSTLVAVLLARKDRGPALVDLRFGDARAGDVLALADPPQHTRQRKLVSAAFSARRLDAIVPRIRALVGELLDEALAGAEVDFVQAFARRLPVLAIGALLGLPRTDEADLRGWIDRGAALLLDVNEPADVLHAATSALALHEHLAKRCREARAEPRDDVLGDLARAMNASADGPTEREAAAIVAQLLIAGYETTKGLIGSATMLLAERPQLQARLRGEPQHLGAFIEEALRLESPFQGHCRQATRDTEIAGTPVAEGTRLLLLWGAANRDEEQFPNPDAIDLERPGGAGHLGFGAGIHRCVGATLARIEARIAIEELLARTRHVALAVPRAALRHRPSPFLRSLVELPLRFS